MLLHDALDRVEAKSSSLSHALRRKKGLEDVSFNFGRNPRTVIANLHDNTVILAIRTHSEDTLSSHRIDCVVDDIRPDLVEFAAERVHQQWNAVVVPLDDHAVFKFVVHDDEGRFQALNDIDVLNRRL